MKRFDRALIPPAPDLSFEQGLWAQGVAWVAGIDEAGRGALAGPVAVGAVILPPDQAGLAADLHGVRDSKEMTPLQRQRGAERIQRTALAWAVGFAGADEIDALGIVAATHLAAGRAVAALDLAPQSLLLDYLLWVDCSLPQTSLVKGDARCLSIAAASICAKTARDALMRRFDAQYPGYGFAVHKGYGTLAHRQALAALGPAPIHRRSFRSSLTKE